MTIFRHPGLRLSHAILIGISAVLSAAPATAKISAMSGAYDGRGKSPETAQAPAAQPKKAKKRMPKPAPGPGGN